MARQSVRFVFVGAAVLGLMANVAGSFLTLQAGRSPTDWQLACVGTGIPAALLGLLVGWHQPRNRIAWLFLAAGVGFGVEQLGIGVLVYPDSPGSAQLAAYDTILLTPAPLTATWMLLILLFPDGRFTRAAARHYASVAVGILVLASLTQLLIAPPGYLPDHYGLAAPEWLAGPLHRFATPDLASTLELPGVLLPGLALLALLADIGGPHRQSGNRSSGLCSAPVSKSPCSCCLCRFYGWDSANRPP